MIQPKLKNRDYKEEIRGQGFSSMAQHLPLDPQFPPKKRLKKTEF